MVEHTGFAWPENAKATLQELWGKESASQIAERLTEEHGCFVTRNAVAGKAHRMGLAVTTVTRRPPPSERKRRPDWWTLPGAIDAIRNGVKAGKMGEEIAADVVAVVGFYVSASAVCYKAASIGCPVPRAAKVRLVKPGKSGRLVARDDGGPSPLMVPLEDLGAGQCHFPIGDPLERGFGFCGVAKEASAPVEAPYCAYHMRLCYQPGARTVAA